MDFEEASEAIMQLDFPSLGEMLDMTIRNRIGNLIWENERAINEGRRTVKEALIGIQPGHYTHLLSFSEMRDLRLRNRLDQIMTAGNALQTMGFVRQSLARLGYDILLDAIGVGVDVKYDRDRQAHIVFINTTFQC